MGNLSIRLLSTLFLNVFVLNLEPAAGSRTEPPKPLPAIVQALQPTGLRISILDEEGVDFVIINANVNVPLAVKESGQMTQTISQAKDGFWTMHAPEKQLKPGDVVFYWAFYSIDGNSRFAEGHQLISELVEPNCLPSITTVNGKPACKGDLVLEDNFDFLNKSLWAPFIQFSGYTDHEFNTYVANKENSFVKDGSLHLKPTVVEDMEELVTPMKLEGCTSLYGGDFCERKPFAWKIIPPTHSARIVSNPAFAFRFGRVEVRAKAAVGDWINSRIWLEPRDNAYGERPFESGRIEAMRVLGNVDLRPREGGDNYGANRNQVMVDVSSCNLVGLYIKQYHVANGLLTDDFHVYGITWTPREIKIDIDGTVINHLRPPQPDGFLSTDWYRNCKDSAYEKGTFMAPFDKEFYLNFAPVVAGHHNYHEGSISGGYTKPYVDGNPKGPLDFWLSRDKWLPTWKEDFRIDSVKVWAL